MSTYIFMYFKKHNIMNEYLEIKFRNVQARQVSPSCSR